MILGARAAAVLLAAGVAVSIGVYLVIGNADEKTNGRSRVNSILELSPHEQFAQNVFSPTGKYVDGDPSMPLVIQAFELTPEYISVSYTLVGGPKDVPQSFAPTIVDDKGQAYRTLGNAVLGSAEGVLAGVLVVEPHIPGGSLLTIQAGSAVMAGGATQGGPWSIAFLQTTEPNAPTTFIEGGRLSPEEGVVVNGAQVGIAGPPGSSPVEVLVHRNGKTTSLFGVVERKGEARPVSSQEFQAMFGSTGYPRPPAFPTTAPVAP